MGTRKRVGRMVRPGATAAVYAVVFVAFVDVFALLPTIAPYAVSLGAEVSGVGVAVGSYSATNLVFNLVGGALLDRMGRRRILLWGLGLATVTVASYAAAASPAQLVGVRLVHGVAGGLVVPAVFTIAGDLAPAQGRGRVMGRMGAAIGVAAVAAPAAAGALRQAVGFDAVFAGIAGLTAAGLLLAAVAIHDPVTTTPRLGRGAGVVALLRRRELQVSCVAVAALTFAVGTLAAFLPLHAEDVTGRPAVTGLLFTTYAVVASLVMLTGPARSVDLLGPRVPVSGGLTIVAIACGALVTAPELALTVVVVAVFGLGYGLVFPAASGFIAAATGPGERGRSFGAFNACFSLGVAVGAPASAGLSSATGVDPFLPAVVITVAGGLFAAVRREATSRPD